MLIDSYLTIEKESVYELKILNSKFIAHAYPVTVQCKINEKIKEVKKKYFDASHHPYAYRLEIEKNIFKTSDDGEPQGTAGKPILEVIDKYNLTDILIVVSRYFGGTKLGTGGLRRAFYESAISCISSSKIIEKLLTEKIQIETDYTFMNNIMKLIESEKLRLTENHSDEKCRLTLEVRFSAIENVKSKIMNITNGSVKFIG